MAVSKVQFLKALLSMVVTDDGSVTVVREVQREKVNF